MRLWCCLLVSSGLLTAAESTFHDFAQPFLDKYCIDCHDDLDAEGGISFEQLGAVTPENAQYWKQIWEQVALRDMPPRKKKTQPTLDERYQIGQWIIREIDQATQAQGGFTVHLLPQKGNHLDHDLLFNTDLDQLELKPTASPARLWRVDPNEQLVRMNDLVCREPYDPQRPGARTRGDLIAPGDHGGVALKLGMRPQLRVNGVSVQLRDGSWFRDGETFKLFAGGEAIAAPLTTAPIHGLRSYPHLYTVNGAESNRIAQLGAQVLRALIAGPHGPDYALKVHYGLDRPRALRDGKVPEGSPGLPASPVPVTPIYNLARQEVMTDAGLTTGIVYLYQALTGRAATHEIVMYYLDVVKGSIEMIGPEEGLILGLSSVFLDRDALFRSELVKDGTPDEYGRVALGGEELMLALNAALSYLGPDEELKQALADGRLHTKDDVRREVTRMLNDPTIRKPRVLQFFREYFEYDMAGGLSKDGQRLLDAGAYLKSDKAQTWYYQSVNRMIRDADRLIELILEQDRDVLQELLTTDRVIYDPSFEDVIYFMSVEERFEYFAGFREFNQWVRQAEPTVNSHPLKHAFYIKKFEDRIKTTLADLGQPIEVRAPPSQMVRSQTRMLGRTKSTERMGLLTHPVWLIAHSDAMDNHAIRRGLWIRERLLGDAVPDVPITVNAMLPDEPDETLRHRMRVTKEDECWRCHKKIDDLGLAFEMYNHVGLIRSSEKGKPVDASGAITYSGDPDLDGDVANALEMIQKLSESQRVEQVFVRHAFRFWMGRNETIDDAPVLREAYRVYRESGGSMKQLLVSLLTSDAFLYRKLP